MEKCLLCLSLRKSFIGINSLEWKELHVISLIEKHLWPMEYNTTSVICKKCWKELSAFHKFFLNIQKSHNVIVFKNIKSLNKDKISDSVDNDLIQNSNDFVVEEKNTDVEQCVYNTKESDPLTELKLVNLTDDNGKSQDKNIEPLDDKTNNYETLLENTHSNSELLENYEITTELDPLTELRAIKLTDDKHKKSLEIETNTDSDLESLENNEIAIESDCLTEPEVVKSTDDDRISQQKNIESLENENIYSTSTSLENNEIAIESDCLTELEVVKPTDDDDKSQQKTIESLETENISSNTESLENNKITSRTNSLTEFEIEKNLQTKENNCQSNLKEIDPDLKSFEKSKKATKSKNNKIKFDESDKFIAKHIKINCCSCHINMQTFSQLHQHFKEQHKGKAYVICCEKKFFQRWTLYDHLMLHKNPNYYKCSHCNKVLPNRLKFRFHLKNHKDLVVTKDCDSKNERKLIDRVDRYIAKHIPIQCCLCKNPYKKFSDLCQHFEESHKIRGYVICCNQKFLRRWLLHDHLILHKNPNYYKCSKCGEVMPNRLRLKYHLKSHKEKVPKTYNCEVCGHISKELSAFKIHRSTHLSEEEKKIECTECGKRFAIKCQLTKHTQVVHLKIHAKVCEICGKSFCSDVALRYHMIKHTDKPAPTFDCDVCGLKLSSKSVLKRHKNSLHPVDPIEYTCTICSKVSKTINAHKWHMNSTHFKRYDHKCTICDKAFTKACRLRDHMATHTGTAVHKCPWCPKTFSSSGNFHSHRKNKHPEEWLEFTRKKYSGKLPPQKRIKK